MSRTYTVESDGLDIVVEETGSGPAILFAHGLTGTRNGVLEQFRPLENEYRIITYDQRGHGDSSPVTDPRLYDPHMMARDMAAVMDAAGFRRFGE